MTTEGSSILPLTSPSRSRSAMFRPSALSSSVGRGSESTQISVIKLDREVGTPPRLVLTTPLGIITGRGHGHF